jgi:hypothetical protein
MTDEAPHPVRVFVNAVGVEVPPGASALDAVRRWNPDEAAAVARGERVITDSRGLPVDAGVRVSAGSIFRLLPARRQSSSARDATGDDGGGEDT